MDEVLASDRVSDEIIGFHRQQAAEKLLKALLSDLGGRFQRTHNLRVLVDLVADAGHALPARLSDLDTLTPYGTLFRYEHAPSDKPLKTGALRVGWLKRCRCTLSGTSPGKNGAIRASPSTSAAPPAIAPRTRYNANRGRR